jgi:hypothetical protein
MGVAAASLRFARELSSPKRTLRESGTLSQAGRASPKNVSDALAAGCFLEACGPSRYATHANISSNRTACERNRTRPLPRAHASRVGRKRLNSPVHRSSIPFRLRLLPQRIARIALETRPLPAQTLAWAKLHLNFNDVNAC